jgi:two-component system NtrC family response regulator
MADTEQKKNILIIDDDQNIRKQMRWALDKEYTVLQGGDRDAAIALCQKHMPGVMTLDLGLPPDPDGSSEGLRTLQEMLRINPKIKIIVFCSRYVRSLTVASGYPIGK